MFVEACNMTTYIYVCVFSLAGTVTDVSVTASKQKNHQ